MSGTGDCRRHPTGVFRWSSPADEVREPIAEEPGGTSGYRVQIIYTEPEFQMRNPQCPPEFSFSRHYPEAGSPQEAVRQAMDYFDFCAEHSRVSWRRIIKALRVERI